ncbi:hypothetical protein [Propylenella binzhouense]|uniref:Uncharacterized protein n=1 Tax=Propylenella binzhouense TaxID=2555902 RepID=A0A964T6M3_9HYPH|nr:hypothetical protein [Propylenella binzhouense]MYZ48794.1 hypothetical protein [Propylenella binzhouense]
MSLAYRFFLAGILFAIAGMSLGTYMGSTHDFTFAPVHAHINLVGWTTFFLFGLYYRGDEISAGSMLGEAHFVCALLGGVFLPVGIVGAVTGNASLDLAIIPGTLLTLASMVLFLAVVARAWSRQRSDTRTRFAKAI